MEVKEIGAALKNLLKGGASLEVLRQMINDASLSKAAANLSESEKVLDHWQASQIHAGVSKEEIRVGPQGAASGDGAEKMVAHYSDTTAQRGTTQVAESLARLLGPINSSMKSIFEIVEKHDKIFAEMFKSEAAPAAKAKDEDEEEDSEVVEINSSKAKRHLRKAKALVAKAEDAEDRKAEKDLLSKASKQFAFARGHARLAGDLELDKSIRKDAMEAGIKADINVVEEEEESDEDKKAKAKTDDSMQEKEAEAKAKADAEAKAKTEAEAKAKADAEAAAKGGQTAGGVTQKQLQDALAGVAMLETSVKGLMEMVSGSSKGSHALPPNFIKSATAEQVTTLRDQIGDMQDAGSLSDPDALAAYEILDKMALVKSGHLDESVVTARIMKSSSAVKTLFKLAA